MAQGLQTAQPMLVTIDAKTSVKYNILNNKAEKENSDGTGLHLEGAHVEYRRQGLCHECGHAEQSQDHVGQSSVVHGFAGFACELAGAFGAFDHPFRPSGRRTGRIWVRASRS
jgi:hypothetical protein